MPSVSASDFTGVICVAGHQPTGRFLSVEQNDMRVAPCVRAVVYEDGSVERF